MSLITQGKLQIMESLGYVVKVIVKEHRPGYIVEIQTKDTSILTLSKSNNEVMLFDSADSALDTLRDVGIINANVELYEHRN
ncbi:hypothetical protein M9194_02155 [Vibrio sp. S4M6]|uniref:hypothetical protein n=1 Tax=Vibrio sinus TaxID=2946865 RepID=UPI00202AB825|nr:hypothetical protein [Vibrio sinus]MCL9780233.1 hypothetical protein [Vibrio sinus]